MFNLIKYGPISFPSILDTIVIPFLHDKDFYFWIFFSSIYVMASRLVYCFHLWEIENIYIYKMAVTWSLKSTYYHTFATKYDTHITKMSCYVFTHDEFDSTGIVFKQYKKLRWRWCENNQDCLQLVIASSPSMVPLSTQHLPVHRTSAYLAAQ